VSGRVTANGQGVPAEIVVTAWGKEAARSKAGADGRYALEGVPLAAHLRFVHGSAAAEKVLLWDDPKLREIHFKIYSTDFVGTPGALAGCFPPDHFARLREMAKEVTVDAELRK
jgi:hypothetical protein